jgi:DEAD/DEAH box helicase domain-containing protein
MSSLIGWALPAVKWASVIVLIGIKNSNEGRAVIQLFDEVSGGAGFVLEGLNDVTELLKAAQKHLQCPVNCENICSHCLASQDSRVEREELDRKLTLEWLTNAELVEHLKLPDIFSGIHDGRYCSVGPARDLTQAINSLDRSDKTISLLLCLHGGQAEWDLDYPGFREQVLTWTIAEKLKVRIGLAEPQKLSEEHRETLSLLTRMGVELVKLDSNALNQPYLIAQLSSQAKTRSLYCSTGHAGVPGEDWLKGLTDAVWVTSEQATHILGEPIDTAGWHRNVQGARIVEITSQLDGPVNTLKMRLETLLKEHMPELSELLTSDDAVSVSYSDRYLKSPWSLILLNGFLELFTGDKLQSLTVQTLASHTTQPSFQISHDWTHPDDQQAVIERWLKEQLDVSPNITMMNKAYELLHGRMITVKWASGKVCKILLDQGMGYWRARMPYRDQLNFDFHASHDEQLQQLFEKYSYTRMQQRGEWPTYISCVME